MTFEFTNRIAVLIMSGLALTLLFAPGILHWLFAIDSGAAVDVMSRRAALLFAGLIVLVCMSQSTTSMEVQHLVSAVMVVVMGGLLVLGLVDWLRGAVGIGIWLALLVEGAFAVLYFRFWQE